MATAPGTDPNQAEARGTGLRPGLPHGSKDTALGLSFAAFLSTSAKS